MTGASDPEGFERPPAEPQVVRAERGCVLIVDDDFDIRGLMTNILQIEGYHVLAAANGREALETLRSGARPRLILLDLMMPVMNGWQFRCEQLLDDRLAAIPVVVLSGAADVGERARTIGASGILRKPVDLDVLLEVVGRYC
jgi:CheY-like chemotaxis protein